MKEITLLLALLIYTSIFSQNPVDYDLIDKNTKNSKSEYYYPELMKKFQKGDTTLTLEQKRHLYYGYTFQENFKKFKFNGLLDSISKYEELNTDASLLKALKFREEILSRNPFEAGIIDGKIAIYKKLGDHKEFMKGIHQITLIFDSIMSSGDGLTKENAIVLTSVSAEYEIVSILGFTPIKEPVVIDKNFEFVEVANNDKNVKGIYFDVSKTTYRMQY
jgi:hypothetical protein